jgi:endonuclease/exonuclease/phosphatase family metal-dependent hydrolase
MGERAEAAPAAIGSVAFEPTVLNRRSAGVRFPLKVAALNLRGSGQVEAIAACLKRPPLDGAGVLLLSEVAWRTRWSGRREVAAELASILGMSFVFAPSWGYRSSHDGSMASLKGCAILSAQPLIDVATPPIPALPHRHNPHRRIDRHAGIVASIVIGGREIKVGVVHLSRGGSPQFRARQMDEYLAGFPSGDPAVVGGDFNTTTIAWNSFALAEVAALMMLRPRRFRDPARYEPLLGRLGDAGFAIDGANVALKPTFTFTRIVPPVMRPKLDWIAIRGLRAVAGSAAVVAPRASVLSRRISDHDLVVCEVTA